ncbi:hypothetical protein J2X01_003343 [Arthrobacter ginsengisoli]|uniref:Uncharacterized protein n=1 Tax=Arthrobacter ginsengisoli TaxID=1356565 RepID=A0ABU1UFS5_9MICC|nr:hypothetical protein [Arthrobacter ginsengisoli]MDR7084036.1 hypothetical protein [Arthrobacter ginsengisoli]
MTRPDSNSPDPDSSANQDDAVWLDLVARLEGRDQPASPGTAEVLEATGDTDSTVGTESQPGTDEPAADASDASDVARAAAPRPFSDFDPLGLSGGAPVELSAEERQARSEAAGAAPDGPESAPGPRDHAAADDDPLAPGEFVPEEPPSLAGTDPLTVLAWLGAVGGPVALLMSAMFWRSAPLLAILGMVAAFAASLVFLIMKLPGEKDEHDDGARI